MLNEKSAKPLIWAAYLESQNQLAAMAARVSERDGEIIRLKAELAEATLIAKTEHAARQAAARALADTATSITAALVVVLVACRSSPMSGDWPKR